MLLRSLQIREASQGADHPELAYTLTSLGLCALDAKRPTDGVEPLERALALRSNRDEDPRLLAFTQFALAQVLWATRSDRKRAVALARSARDAYASSEGADVASQLPIIENWLQSRTR